MAMFKSYSDQEVILALHKGGRDENRVIAFLLKKNEVPIYGYILKNSGNKENAATILVEGVTELVLNVRNDKFKGESSLSTYLFSICRGLWLKQLKKDFKHADWDNSIESEAVEEVEFGTEFSASRMKEEVGLLMAKVGENCKKVLEMWSQQYSMTEIAERMGYKNSQIAMNKKNKCLSALKAFVRENTQLSERMINYLS